MDLIQLLQSCGWLRLYRATREELSGNTQAAYSSQDERALGKLGSSEDRTISPGVSVTGRRLEIPVSQLLGHGLILGATGSGKTCSAQSLVQQLLAPSSLAGRYGVGVVDPKGDLFKAALATLNAASSSNRLITTLDLAGLDSVIPFDILKAREDDSLPDLVTSRMETFADLLGREGQLSLRMHRMLRLLIGLLLEFGFSFASLEEFLERPELSSALGSRSKNERVRRYFRRDFLKELSTTLPALRYRLDHLFARDNVRLSLSSGERPDFCELMDGGGVVLVNLSGAGKSAARVFQSLILSDIRSATFARRRPETPFIWLMDEAHVLFARESDKDNLSSILTMARSFGVYIVLITQSLRSALGDGEFYQNLETNFRWLHLLRSGPADAAILRPGLRLTGSVPSGFPLRGRLRYLTPQQETQHLLQEITNLPAREGFFWLRGSGARAVRLRTHKVRQSASGVHVPEPSWRKKLVSSVKKRLAEEEKKLKALAEQSAPTKGVEEFLARVEKDYVRES